MRLPADRSGSAPPVAARAGFTALVALFEAAHLAWEQLHGGIVSHHLLNDASLPAIWNGWGLLVLPALAWIASGRAFHSVRGAWRLRVPFARALLVAALAGGALSAAFAFGREDIAGGVLIGLLLAAVVVRAYRVECLLGFVLGMAYTFGAILPTLIGGSIALVSAVAWFGVYPLAKKLIGRTRRVAP